MRQPCAAAGVHAGDAAVPFWRGRLLRVNWHQQLNLLLDFWKNQRIFTTETAGPSLSKVLLSGGFDFPQPFCSGGGRSTGCGCEGRPSRALRGRGGRRRGRAGPRTWPGTAAGGTILRAVGGGRLSPAGADAVTGRVPAPALPAGARRWVSKRGGKRQTKDLCNGLSSRLVV